MLVLAIFAAVTLGIPLGLYALLTRGRRRTMREIKDEATQRGWEYHARRWLGDPTAFRINGWTPSGLNWILKSGGTDGDNRGWTVILGLRIPKLGGETDTAIFPRDSGRRDSVLLTTRLSPSMQARVAVFSGTVAGAVTFFEHAREFPSGLPAFDKACQILALPERVQEAPIDAALAERILHWPADTITGHSVLAWRDPFGLHFQARLPAPPNWATITYFLTLAEDLCARLPSPVPAPTPSGFVDSIVARFLQS